MIQITNELRKYEDGKLKEIRVNYSTVANEIDQPTMSGFVLVKAADLAGDDSSNNVLKTVRNNLVKYLNY